MSRASVASEGGVMDARAGAEAELKPAAVAAPPAASTAAPPPGRLEPLADEIFLTPRVVDKRTFDEFSALLRELVRAAQEQGKSLRGASQEAGGVKAGLESIAAELGSRLDAALKVVPALEQRTARAEQLMKVAIDREALAERVAAQAGPLVKQVVEDALARLREQAAAIAETTLGRLQQATRQTEGRLHDAAESAVARLEAAQAQARQAAAEIHEQAGARLADAARHAGIEAQAVAQRLREDLDRAAEDHAHQAGAARDEGLAAIEAARREGLDALRGLGEEVAARAVEAVRQAELALETAASRHASALEADAERTLASAREAQGKLAVGVEQAARGVDDMLADLDAKLRPVHQWASQLVSEVEKRLDEWRQRAPDEAPRGRLPQPAPSAQDTAAAAALSAELATVRAACEGAASTLRSLVEQAQTVRAALADAMHRGAEHADALHRELDSLDERRRGLEAAVADAAERADRAAAAIRELAAEAGQPLATFTSARQQLEQMSGWLAQTAASVRDTGQAATAILARAQDSARSLSTLLARLEPWRPLLLDGRADGPLPPALEAIVNELGERARRHAAGSNGAA